MAQTFLVFDFETNEQAAQQARHKFEGWKQAFRLGDKALLKFERTPADGGGEEKSGKSKSIEAKSAEGKAGASAKDKSASGAKKSGKTRSSETEAGDNEEASDNSRVRIFIRLSFSDHEKLSQQRWLDRIPSEEPFKAAKSETIRHSDASFAKTSELFDSLD
jgi:hypothetical protein